MAEIDIESAKPEQLISQGIRAYIIHDYNNAVQMLSKAIEKVTAQKDEKDDYLGEAYLYYGKSLLEYSREEDDPFGDAVPREIKTGESEDTDDEENEDEENDAAETAEQTGKEQDEPEQAKTDDEKSLESTEESKVDKEVETKVNKKEVESKDEKEAVAKIEKETETKGEKVKSKEENETESKEEDEADSNEDTSTVSNTEKSDTVNGDDKESDDNVVASSSTEKDDEKGEDITGEEVEDDNPTDLQLAWEVLELAKIIFKGRAEKGEKSLADTLVSLGEVSMESENFASAINDIKDGIEIQERICEKHSRILSESYYKLGIAYAANNQLDEAVQYFEKSHAILVDRSSVLEKDAENNRDELKELKGLIPEIQEKITDTRNFKNELAKQKGTNDSEKETSVTPTSADKINDISHLVKRKRMLTTIEEDEQQSPAKKPSP